MQSPIELSIVVPTLNEQEQLGEFLAMLRLQEKVRMEVIIADGGSDDATCMVAASAGALLVHSSRGRGVQLNAGAAVARGAFMLFLHADSRFVDPFACRKSLDLLVRTASAAGKDCAGHFAVRFRHDRDGSQCGFRFLERKARLSRKGCTHGDQGLLVPAGLFVSSGGFDCRCLLLAETRFADSLRQSGRLLLLPAEITTSPRRFDKEGFAERQALNAVIMALGEAGRDDLLGLPGLYVRDDQCGRLDLKRVFGELDRRLAQLGSEDRAQLWLAVGKYICENVWQVALWVDVQREVRCSDGKTEVQGSFLERYDRCLYRLVNNRIAWRLAAAAGRLWVKFMAVI